MAFNSLGTNFARTTSGAGARLPFDGYMSALQFAGDDSAVASNGDLILLGTCGPSVDQNCDHAAIRPGGWRQLRQGIEHFVRFQDALFVGGDGGDQSNAVGTDDEVGIAPALD